MKVKYLLFFYITLFSAKSILAQEKLQFFPEKPLAGEELRFSYELEGSTLESSTSFQITAYLVEESGQYAKTIKWQRNGSKLHGVLSSRPNTKILFLKIQNQDGSIIDNNQDKGYSTFIYAKNDSDIQVGSLFWKGMAYYSYYRMLGLERDIELGMELMKKEFQEFPKSQSNPQYASIFGSAAARYQNKEALELVKGMADEFSKKRRSDKSLTTAYFLYGYLLDRESAAKLEKRILKKFPNGQLAKQELRRSFFQTGGDLDKMEQIFAKLERIVDPSKDSDIQMLSLMANQLALAYGKNEKWEKFDKYNKVTNDIEQIAETSHVIAMHLAGNGLDSKSKNLEAAAALCRNALEFKKSQLDNLNYYKPIHLTPSQWEEKLKDQYGMMADSYAMIQYKSGNFQEALKYSELSLQNLSVIAPDRYERHVTYLEKNGQSETAESLIAKLIQENKATPDMKKAYKRLFLANNTLESAYHKHIALLEKENLKAYQKELKEKMIDEPAPDFSLVNQKGETVKLSDLKGRVVVIDFWATWCKPCIGLFPSMQKLVDKYKEDDTVSFLFINTWENASDKKQLVNKFLSQNNYNFNVPLDLDAKVVESFGVQGIPAKFVIDARGHVRFFGMGFDGNSEDTIKELAAMIELVK